ncbi:MAG: dienelactone hydrolase family protein [Armatimonadetes bacterium]|nr:dienelactone hydrolase family protein [Armatimonadota bacterium]
MIKEFGFLERTNGPLPYVVYVPRLDPMPKELPTILFLHGRGESGADGLRQTLIGLSHAIRNRRTDWPFLVIAPQKPEFDKLWPAHRDDLDKIIQLVEKEFPTDPHRRYITGLSQGGNGTFELADKLSWHFAAMAPVCGWSDRKDLHEAYQSIPCWAFHGDADQAVPIQKSIDAIKQIDSPLAKLTTYPGVGHNSWDNAYQNEKLGEWFLSHTLE